MFRRRRKSKLSDSPHLNLESQGESESMVTLRSNWRSWGLVVLAIVASVCGYVLLRGRSMHDADNISTEAHVPREPLATLATDSVRIDQAVVEKQLDPNQDGWETEVLAEQAKTVLTRLAERLTGRDTDKEWSTSVSEEVRTGYLYPQELVEVFRNGSDDKTIVVRRAESDTEQTIVDPGLGGLRFAFDELAKPFAEASGVHVHIKVIRVSKSEDVVETTAYFEAEGHTSKGSLQQRATWNCRWRQLPAETLELVSIHATDFEEVVESGSWFVDCTKAVLGKNRSFREQLSFGLNYWLSRLDRVYGIHVFARTGLAVGDANGDGLDDVYVCQPGGLPNRLFVQETDGTATDRSRDAGVDWLDQTSSALFLDLDNDGDQELVTASSAGLLVMENDGTGKFSLRATLTSSDIDTQSISAVDFDNDGDLDLYVCLEFSNHSSLSSEAKVAFVYHDANDGAANLLFRNDIESKGKWKFTNVTKEVGLDVDNRRHSLACAWEDYDNDGDQDLYVANDYGQNCLYRNDGEKFENVALQTNAVDLASGMSVSWGDYNRDGWMDLYVANMFSSAGSRITRQEQFSLGADNDYRKIYSRFAKGNTLLENDGQGKFREVSKSAGVEMGRWAWSSVFADINNDAWDDMLVANGYITTEDTGDL